mmetsp:Transcript_3441/g.5916  ORF Transcript_3441/g.5916 Transcript_3441/m.5916 type:complete len:94 (+) Transcript_3441:883-1164(+)
MCPWLPPMVNSIELSGVQIPSFMRMVFRQQISRTAKDEVLSENMFCQKRIWAWLEIAARFLSRLNWDDAAGIECSLLISLFWFNLAILVKNWA